MFVKKGNKIVATVAPLAVAMGMIMGSTAMAAKNPNSYAQDRPWLYSSEPMLSVWPTMVRVS